MMHSTFQRYLHVPMIVMVWLSCAPLTLEPYNRVTVSIQGSGAVEGLVRDTLLRRGDTLRLFAIPD